MSKRLLILAAAAAMAAGTVPALAQGIIADPSRLLDPSRPVFQANPGLPDVTFENRVYFSCQIMEQRRAVITNNTGKSTTDGTAIWYDIVLIATGAHQTEFLTERGLPAGQHFAPGVPPSSSCTAWYVAPLENAPF